MIVKLDNKSKNFYNYMGRFFGSRIVQLDTKDRVYDDNNKLWYIYLRNDTPIAFASVCKNIIKNIYTVNTDDLAELLNYIKSDISVSPSIVTNLYLDIYKQCDFIIDEDGKHKNFVIIRSDADEEGNFVSRHERKNG